METVEWILLVARSQKLNFMSTPEKFWNFVFKGVTHIGWWKFSKSQIDENDKICSQRCYLYSMIFHEIFLSTRIKSSPEIKQKNRDFAWSGLSITIQGQGFGQASASGSRSCSGSRSRSRLRSRSRSRSGPGPVRTLPAKVAKLNKAKHKLWRLV